MNEPDMFLFVSKDTYTVFALRPALKDAAWGDVESTGDQVLAELEKLCQSPEGHRGLQRCLDWGLLAPWQQNGPASAALEPLSRQRAKALGFSAVAVMQDPIAIALHNVTLSTAAGGDQ